MALIAAVGPEDLVDRGGLLRGASGAHVAAPPHRRDPDDRGRGRAVDEQAVPLREGAEPVDGQEPDPLVAKLPVALVDLLTVVAAEPRDRLEVAVEGQTPKTIFALVAFQMVSAPTRPQRCASCEGDCTDHTMWMPRPPASATHRSSGTGVVRAASSRISPSGASRRPFGCVDATLLACSNT